MLQGSNAQAIETFNKLFNTLLIRQDDIWIKSEIFQAIENAQIPFSNFSSICSKSRWQAIEIFEGLVQKLFTKQNNIWVKSELFHAIENSNLTISNLAGILSKSGINVLTAFDGIINQLFSREGNGWVKSNLLKILESTKSLPKISSILNGAGKDVAIAFNELVHALFIEENGNWHKSKLLEAIEDAGINLSNISSILSASGILHGAGIRAPETFKLLFDQLLTKQDNIWVKSELLQALEKLGISLPNISGILHGTGVNAPETFNLLLEGFEIYLPNLSGILCGAGKNVAKIFDRLVAKLLTKKGNGWVKSELLNTLEKENMQLIDLLHLLGNSRSKAPEALDNLFHKLFVKQGNTYVKSEILRSLESANVHLSQLSTLLHAAGIDSAQAIDNIFQELFTKQGNNWVKSEQLNTLERFRIPLPTFFNILKGAQLNTGKAFAGLFKQFFSKHGDDWVKSELLKTAEASGISLTQLANILSGAGVHSVKAVDDLFKKFFTRQGDNWIKSSLLEKLETAGISLFSLSRILKSSGPAATKAFDDLFKKLFIKQGDNWGESKILNTIKESEIPVSYFFKILRGTGRNAAEAFEELFKAIFTEQGDKWVKSDRLEELKRLGIDLSDFFSILDGTRGRAAKVLDDLLKKLVVKQGNNWVKSDMFKTLEASGMHLTYLSKMLHGAGLASAQALDNLFKKFFTKQGDEWVESELLNTLEELGINFSDFVKMLKGSGRSSDNAFENLFKALFTKQGSKWDKSDMFKILEASGINLGDVASILHGAGKRAHSTINYLFNKLFTQEGGIWVKSKIFKALERANVQFSHLASILSNSGANAVRAIDKLFKVLFVKENDNWVKSEMFNSMERVGLSFDQVANILHGAGIRIDKSYKSFFNLIFVTENNQYVLKANINPNTLDKQMVVQLMQQRKSGSIPQDSINSITASNHENVFHALLTDAINQQEPLVVLNMGEVEEFLDDTEQENLADINIDGDIETLEVDDLIEYIENQDDVSVEEHFSLSEACSSGASRHKRSTNELCIIDSENYEIFESEESYRTFARAYQESQITSPVANRYYPSISLKRLAHWSQEAFNVFILFKDLLNHDLESLERDTIMLYALPKSMQLIEENLLKLSNKFPILNKILGGKIGSIITIGLSINDLQDAIKSLSDASDDTVKKISETRITTDVGFISLSLIDLGSLCILGSTSAVGIIAGILLMSLSTFATAHIQTRSLCQELECNSHEYWNILRSFIIDTKLSETIQDNLEAQQIYKDFLDITSKAFRNLTDIDAYVTSLPIISIEEVQKYTGTLERIPELSLAYCGVEKNNNRKLMLIDSENNIVNLLSLSNSTKYSPHSRIIKLSHSEDIQLACNPIAHDVQRIDTIPASDTQEYATYYQQSAICIDCTQVPKSDIMLPDQTRYAYSFTTDWLCNNNNIPCITRGNNREYYNQVQQACSTANGKIKSQYEVHKLIIADDLKSDITALNTNYCNNTFALVKSSQIEGKQDHNITVLYKDLHNVKAANNHNIFMVKNTGKYIGGNSTDIFLINKQVKHVSIKAAQGSDVVIIDKHLKNSSHFDIDGGAGWDTIIVKYNLPHKAEISCLGQKNNVIIEYGNKNLYEYYKPSLQVPYSKIPIIDLRQSKMSNIVFSKDEHNLIITDGAQTISLSNWDNENYAKVMLLVQEGILNGKILDLTKCNLTQLTTQPHLAMSASLDGPSICNNSNLSYQNFQICKNQCITKAELPQIGQIIIKGTGKRNFKIINDDVSYFLEIDDKGFNWRLAEKQNKTMLILIPEDKEILILTMDVLKSYNALSIPQVKTAMELKFYQQKNSLILELLNLGKFIFIEDFYQDKLLGQQLLAINLAEEKILKQQLKERLEHAQETNPYIIYDLNPEDEHQLDIELSINQPIDTKKIAILDLNKVNNFQDINLQKQTHNLILTCRAHNNNGTNTIKIVNWDINPHYRAMLWHNNKIFNLTKCNAQQLENIDLTLNCLDHNQDGCTILPYRSKRAIIQHDDLDFIRRTYQQDDSEIRKYRIDHQPATSKASRASAAPILNDIFAPIKIVLDGLSLMIDASKKFYNNIIGNSNFKIASPNSPYIEKQTTQISDPKKIYDTLPDYLYCFMYLNHYLNLTGCIKDLWSHGFIHGPKYTDLQIICNKLVQFNQDLSLCQETKEKYTPHFDAYVKIIDNLDLTLLKNSSPITTTNFEQIKMLEGVVAEISKDLHKSTKNNTNKDVLEITTVITNHRFEPDIIHVPSGKKIRLVVHNQDDTVEEFESTDLHREKIIMPGSSITIILAPLAPATISVSFSGMGDELLNVGIILLTVVLISWTIVWMQGYGIRIKQSFYDLSQKINSGKSSCVMLVLIVAATVLREGMEIIILVYSISSVEVIDGSSYLLGVIIGMISGFFLVLLMLIAGGFAAEAAGILTSSGIIMFLSDQLWDSSWLIPDRSIHGNPTKPHLLIAITAERGLCGSFNFLITKQIKSDIINLEKAGKQVKLMIIGKKGYSYLKKLYLNYIDSYFDFPKFLSNDWQFNIQEKLMNMIINEEIGNCQIYFNKCKNAMVQIPTKQQIFPLTQQLPMQQNPYLSYELEGKDLIFNIVNLYITAQINYALLHSNASEEGARMTAMDNATKNATGLIDDLTLKLNKSRQNLITKELIEIIAGMEAL
ncbi:ATP synthase gamma chain [Pseudolycoriella hygida]|uniref:ATP synthase gamma chain n=1 Tax=Pseudolycoriella hygida TaxID=35572 RepID=A0A9Q0S459_9DIPT|nr:ATP synthase gamma chain [Pseudolycoriella hygida]